MSSVKYQILQDEIAEISLRNESNRNALTTSLLSEIESALEKLGGQNQLRVLLLSHSGRAFCAGADLKFMNTVSGAKADEERKNYSHLLSRVLKKIADLPLTTVALVDGACYGGGLGLSGACDWIFAGPKAKFCLSEAKLGLLPTVIHPYLLRRLSEVKVYHLLSSAEVRGQIRAVEMGLADREWKEESLENFLNSLLKLEPRCLRIYKNEMRHKAKEKSYDNYAAELLSTLQASEAVSEGTSAFLEKRSAAWQKDFQGRKK